MSLIKKRQQIRKPVPHPVQVAKPQPTKTQAFNKGMRYVQGQKQTLNSGSNDFTVNLTASGKRLLGISIIPVSAGDITDCQADFSVNNNKLLSGIGLSNLNPNFVQNMIFFPVPQPLTGKDTIQVSVTKNNVGSVAIIFNVFYVPGLA